MLIDELRLQAEWLAVYRTLRRTVWCNQRHPVEVLTLVACGYDRCTRDTQDWIDVLLDQWNEGRVA